MKRSCFESPDKKHIYLALSILLGGVLLIISVLPHSTIEETPYPEISDIFDASMHFLGFCLFDFFLFSYVVQPILVRRHEQKDLKAGVLVHSSGGFTKPRKTAFYFVIGVVWALTCEGSQYFIPSRSFQFLDIFANTLPTLLIFAVAKKLLSKQGTKLHSL